MATKINVTRCAKRNDATALSSVTCNSATAGAAQDYTLTFDGADDHSGIIVHNAGTKDITVKLSVAVRSKTRLSTFTAGRMYSFRSKAADAQKTASSRSP